MLSGSSFGDDALFAHAFGQEDLTEGVVDFVRACVVEVFALEVDLGAAAVCPFTFRSVVLSEAFCEVEGVCSADVVFEQSLEFCLEVFGVSVLVVGFLKLLEGGHEGFGDIFAAELSEASELVGTGFEGEGFGGCGSAGL